MKRFTIPPALLPFTRGPWPAVGLLVACFVVFWVYALPKFAEAAEAKEQTAMQRGLVERQAALAAQAPAEQARTEALTEWWADSAASRITAGSLEAASGALLDLIRTRSEGAGVRVTSIERSVRSEQISTDPPAEIVVINLKLHAERMERLGAALLALEGASEPWLRLGNVTFTRQPYRALPGVQAEMTVYACLEAAGG